MLVVSETAAMAEAAEDFVQQARAFVARHDAEIRPLEIAVAKAWWEANISGKDSDFKAKEQAQNRLWPIGKSLPS
jgi:peptidyl-dipeptidase A